MVWLVQNCRSNKCPKIPRASGGLCPWAPYQGSTLDQLGTLSGPQIPRLLTPPLTTNPGSAPGTLIKFILPRNLCPLDIFVC